MGSRSVNVLVGGVKIGPITILVIWVYYVIRSNLRLVITITSKKKVK